MTNGVLSILTRHDTFLWVSFFFTQPKYKPNVYVSSLLLNNVPHDGKYLIFYEYQKMNHFKTSGFIKNATNVKYGFGDDLNRNMWQKSSFGGLAICWDESLVWYITWSGYWNGIFKITFRHSYHQFCLYKWS